MELCDQLTLHNVILTIMQLLICSDLSVTSLNRPLKIVPQILNYQLVARFSHLIDYTAQNGNL